MYKSLHEDSHRDQHNPRPSQCVHIWYPDNLLDEHIMKLRFADDVLIYKYGRLHAEFAASIHTYMNRTNSSLKSNHFIEFCQQKKKTLQRQNVALFQYI